MVMSLNNQLFISFTIANKRIGTQLSQGFSSAIQGVATDANFVSRIRSLISMRRDPDTAIDAAMPEKLF